MTTALVPEFNLQDRLVKARVSAGLNQTELADRLGVSMSTVRRLEVGSKPARAIDVYGWATACGVDASWLLTGHAPADAVDREYRDVPLFDLNAAA